MAAQHTPELLELVTAVRNGKRLNDAADTLLAFQESLIRQQAALPALEGLVSAIDKKMAYLNPGKQTENWLSPLLEREIEAARAAIAAAKGE